MKVAAALLFLCISVASCFTPQTFTYKNVGNISIELDVYVPDNSPYTKYPVLFDIHGGGYCFGAKNEGSTSQELEESLSRGWVVVSIDYRLAPGAVLNEIVSDVQDAYAWVRTELVQKINIDPDNIIVFGQSAGGGLTAVAGFMLNPRPKALYAFYPGCTNFLAKFAFNPLAPLNQTIYQQAEKLFEPIYTEYNPSNSSDPIQQLYDELREQDLAGWIFSTHSPNATKQEIETILANYSAVLHVDSQFPPMYLCHGLADKNVPYNQSVEMAAALKVKNIPYKLALVPGVGHAWDYHATAEQYKEYIEPGYDFVESYITTPKKGEEKFLVELEM